MNEAGRAKARARTQKWRDEHPGYHAASMRRWRAAHPGVAETRVLAWIAANRDKASAFSRKSRYGVTAEMYAEMVVAQEDRCALCKTPDHPIRNGKPTAWFVDHDHATGEIRGLLCRQCNHGLGSFRDDPRLFIAALLYLGGAR